MKTTPPAHGDTAPGGLGPALPRQPRQLSDAEQRAARRAVEEMSHGGIVTGKDGRQHTSLPEPPK